MKINHVLITGGSGLVGKALTIFLQSKGLTVSHLSRKKGTMVGVDTFLWDVSKQEIDVECIKNCDAIIHLAGAGIADEKWTDERKQEILLSRTQSSALLYNTLKNNINNVKTVISASAIGIYGVDNSDIGVSENAPLGDDFLASVTKSWEQSVFPISTLNIKLITLRIGIVLANEGGALPKMKFPMQFWVGAAVASGKQYLSWIHIYDMCAMIHYALINNQMEGIYNAVAPNPVDNQTFTNKMAIAMNRKVLLPNVPAFVLQLGMGEMAVLVTKGKNVLNTRIKETDFKYKFENLEDALADLLS